ncbi:uncharacterized protein LOC131883254 [Tigriopus californicus]|uniref:uncharacterized protein LOC131883254 n=1 Tax=Tigriopus californicus TaxID=6832 RepID=UPI0027D9E014|nr:uncharacterized protein LOC131883254 [Tigriopus californicus]
MAGDEEKKAPSSGRILKPVDIPIYGFPETPKPQLKVVESEPGWIKSAFTAIRLSLREVTGPLGDVQDKVNHIYETGVAHSKGAYNDLMEEDNGAARLGVIAAGGLLGYTVGALRGRLFKKLFYSTLGFGGSAAVCYPQEANALSKEALDEGRQIGLIAYNFVTGVEPESSKVDISLLTEEDKKDLESVPSKQ